MDNTRNLLFISIIDEIIRAMGLPINSITQILARLFFEKPSLQFTDIILELDNNIEKNGSMLGARMLLKHFVLEVKVIGENLIPETGPLIIVSNHPASYDGIVIAACVPRNDLKIIIGDIQPYRFLPHVAQHAIFSPKVGETLGRAQTIRNSIRHLRAGGALLIFPRGGIEPDPAFMHTPDSEFNHWSHSIEIFLKHAPNTQVLITTVGGVISKKIFNHPFTWFRKSRPDRQRLAFMYQIIRQVLIGRELFGLRPFVTIGDLLSGESTLEDIKAAARKNLKRHMYLQKEVN